MGFFDKFLKKENKARPVTPFDNDNIYDEKDQSSTIDDIFSRKPNEIEIFDSKEVGVLTSLGIERNIDLTGLMSARDIEMLEFDSVGPVGVDPMQVEQFCDEVLRAINKYRDIIAKREDDFERLLIEAQRLEKKYVDIRTEADLSSFMSEQIDEKEELKDQLISLQIENQELKSKLSKLDQTNMWEEKLPPLGKGSKIGKTSPLMSLPPVSSEAPKMSTRPKYRKPSNNKQEEDQDMFSSFLDDF